MHITKHSLRDTAPAASAEQSSSSPMPIIKGAANLIAGVGSGLYVGNKIRKKTKSDFKSAAGGVGTALAVMYLGGKVLEKV